MVHCLLEALETLAEHLSIDINDINGGFPVGILLSYMIEDAECNITSSSSDVNATNWSFAPRFQGRDKVVFPQPVHAQRRRIVHQIILGRHTIENAFYEGFFGFFCDCSKAKRGGTP